MSKNILINFLKKQIVE